MMPLMVFGYNKTRQWRRRKCIAASSSASSTGGAYDDEENGRDDDDDEDDVFDDDDIDDIDDDVVDTGDEDDADELKESRDDDLENYGDDMEDEGEDGGGIRSQYNDDDDDDDDEEVEEEGEEDGPQSSSAFGDEEEEEGGGGGEEDNNENGGNTDTIKRRTRSDGPTPEELAMAERRRDFRLQMSQGGGGSGDEGEGTLSSASGDVGNLSVGRDVEMASTSTASRVRPRRRRARAAQKEDIQRVGTASLTSKSYPYGIEDVCAPKSRGERRRDYMNFFLEEQAYKRGDDLKRSEDEVEDERDSVEHRSEVQKRMTRLGEDVYESQQYEMERQSHGMRPFREITWPWVTDPNSTIDRQEQFTRRMEIERKKVTMMKYLFTRQRQYGRRWASLWNFVDETADPRIASKSMSDYIKDRATVPEGFKGTWTHEMAMSFIDPADVPHIVESIDAKVDPGRVRPYALSPDEALRKLNVVRPITEQMREQSEAVHWSMASRKGLTKEKLAAMQEQSGDKRNDFEEGRWVNNFGDHMIDVNYQTVESVGEEGTIFVGTPTIPSIEEYLKTVPEEDRRTIHADSLAKDVHARGLLRSMRPPKDFGKEYWHTEEDSNEQDEISKLLSMSVGTAAKASDIDVTPEDDDDESGDAFDDDEEDVFEAEDYYDFEKVSKFRVGMPRKEWKEKFGFFFDLSHPDNRALNWTEEAVDPHNLDTKYPRADR